MAYTKVGLWVAGGAPAISATNLDTIEEQYDEVIDEVFDGGGVGRLPMTRMLADTDKFFLRATGAGNDPEFQAGLGNTVTGGYVTHLGGRELVSPIDLV